MKTQTIKMTPEEIKALKKQYQNCTIRTDIQHAHFQIKGSDFTITAYKSGNVVFQAQDLTLHTPKPIEKVMEMAGSDEVGTGDYFGPITVCAVILKEDDYAKIPTTEIMDTKQMQDDTILRIAPLLMEALDYSLLILDNEKYNEIHKTHNLNAIKAKLHNQAYVNLSKKHTLPKLAVIDQFAPAPLYFKYLQGEKEIYRDVQFVTKAENQYLAVACAAIIARFAFLKRLDAYSTHYGMTFPKGAGQQVDTFGAFFVAKYGIETLKKVAKVHFKNTEKIINHDAP